MRFERYSIKMKTSTFKLIIAAAIFAGAMTTGAAGLDDSPVIVVGTVTDRQDNPVVGATVTVTADSGVLAAQATDSLGRFLLQFRADTRRDLSVDVSSVGFARTRTMLVVSGDTARVRIQLQTESVPLGSMTVVPAREFAVPGTRIAAEDLRRVSRQALVPTNPVGAIRNPEVVRVGSAHSSRIRVFGSSPAYHLNGLPIGADPDHYGMFHVLPSSTIDRLELNLYGTDVSRATPSSTELVTPVRFGRHRTGELSVSTIEATGTASIGTDRWFALGAVRKSVLDKLVTRLDIHSNRQTLPPTNFQDISLYAGLRLSPTLRLFVDQYHVQDFLSYQVDSYVANGFVDTYQHSARHYGAIRLQADRGSLQLVGGVAVHDSFEEYSAFPDNESDRSRLAIDLDYKRTSTIATIRGDYLWRSVRLTAGLDDETVYRRSINLRQRNWNFLSPFASSNNPYIYQQGLNELYGSFSRDDNERNSAAYAAVEWQRDGWRVEAGLRGQSFDHLGDKTSLLHRVSLSGTIAGEIEARLFEGTFAENPAGNVLEPYQVIVYDWLSDLRPVRSRLLSLSLRYSFLTGTAFLRSVESLPVLTPDFSRIDEKTGQPIDGFLSARSDGAALYRGVTVSIEKRDLLDDRIGLQASYAYTHSERSQEALRYPDDLDSPHRLRVQADYRMDRDISFGVEFASRSGYPYTPFGTASPAAKSSLYSSDYYESQVAQINSERFPSSISLNVFGEVKIRRGALFFSVANVTNRANPIISTASGYIHDAGIMPTIGYRVTF